MRLVVQHEVFRSSAVSPVQHHVLIKSAQSSGRRWAHQFVKPIELRPTPNSRARKIAVLGGGITGLTTAFQLARTIPGSKITLFEKSSRVGGWLSSEVVKTDEGEVIFEWGPRTLRPDSHGAGLATLALLVQLGIHEQVIGVSKRSPAATNRYVYYPDRLVRLPGPDGSGSPLISLAKAGYTALTEPLFKGVFSGLVSEPAVKIRSPQVADESVGAFIRRRFGSAVADNLASAVFHGIYAGDIYDLSVRTLLPMLWYAETRDSDGNGVIAEFADMFFKNQYMRRYSDVHFQNLTVTAQDIPKETPTIEAFINSIGRDVSVYTFGRGTELLIETLMKALADNSNISIQTNTAVESLHFDESSKQVTIGTHGGLTDGMKYDYVVSTLSPAHLQNQLSIFRDNSSHSNSALEQEFTKVSDAVDVMVVNLYFSSAKLLDYEGFGYLLPRSISLEQNPERALGVIFGSETSGLRGPDAIQKISRATPEMAQEVQKDIEKVRHKLDDSSTDEAERKKLNSILKMLIETEKRFQDELQTSGEKTLRFGQDTAPGTKLTVMMGGHWWKDWQEDDLPTEAQAIDMARSVLARHLKITDTPLVAKARMNRKCIPQYRPGYRQSMATIHREVLKDFQGRLKLAGGWWQGGVGVNDCVRKARLAAFSIREEWDEQTGLEEYCEKEKYVIGDTRTGKVVMDPLQ